METLKNCKHDSSFEYCAYKFMQSISRLLKDALKNEKNNNQVLKFV